MHIESEIKRWGNSLALRITGVMAEIPRFSDGTKVTVEVTEDALIIKRASKLKRVLSLPFTERDLLNGITPSKAHADELAAPTKKELGL
ncbi:Cell growth regulatory protein MazE [gamma proteobacterium HdN1]|nr:Cell growth regulatory protein MazE [gamma proteobacterium HdN1]